MKTLLLIRHAKSDWGNPALDDFDRPLNDRGKRDAPEMAKRLREKKIEIDLILSSPAKRAAKTAKAFAKVLDVKKKNFMYHDDLYLAASSVFFEVIAGIDKKYDTVALFSHNFGITDFANQLTETRIDNIPTCGIFAVKADCDTWEDFKEAKKQFWFFDYPKSVAGS